jgi:hypothetical protein
LLKLIGDFKSEVITEDLFVILRGNAHAVVFYLKSSNSYRDTKADVNDALILIVIADGITEQVKNICSKATGEIFNW